MPRRKIPEGDSYVHQLVKDTVKGSGPVKTIKLKNNRDPNDLLDDDEPVETDRIKFECPCGSKSYTAHKKNNGMMGPGGRSWITHYSCDGCTTHFSDPEKYARAHEAQRKTLTTLQTSLADLQKTAASIGKGVGHVASRTRRY